MTDGFIAAMGSDGLLRKVEQAELWEPGTGLRDLETQPQPAHVRDVPGESVLIESGPRIVAAGVHDALAEKYQQERTARRAAEEELELARKILGQGPYVVIKLSDLNAFTDAGRVEVRLAFGGGVTTDMVRAVLDLGDQAARELGMTGLPVVSGVQVPLHLLGEDHNLFRCKHPDCVRDAAAAAQPVEKPADRGWPENGCPRLGCERFHSGIQHTHAQPAEKPQEGNYGPGQPRVRTEP